MECSTNCQSPANTLEQKSGLLNHHYITSLLAYISSLLKIYTPIIDKRHSILTEHGTSSTPMIMVQNVFDRANSVIHFLGQSKFWMHNTSTKQVEVMNGQKTNLSYVKVQCISSY